MNSRTTVSFFQKLLAVVLLLTAVVIPTYPRSEKDALLSRPDVRAGMERIYRDSIRDGHEHAMVVYPDSTVIIVGDEAFVNIEIKPGAVAYFHIHPAIGLEVPSKQDIAAVQAFQRTAPGVVSYVYGRSPQGKTLYKILPDGTVKFIGLFI